MQMPVSKVSSEAHVVTSDPRRYLRMLCKHFRHKLPTTYDEMHGRIEFAGGTCDLDAETIAGTLKLRLVSSDTEALSHVEDVVARHLKRFALNDPLEVDWKRLP